MKRLMILVLAAAMLLSLAACSSETGVGDASAKGENVILKKQISELEDQVSELTARCEAAEASAGAQPATGEPLSAIPEDAVIAINAKLDNGETMLRFDGSATVIATAEIPEGMALDAWKINGVAEELEEGDKPLPEKEFSVSGMTVIEAALRPEYKVTTINAHMQFLNSKNKPKGDEFTEFVFEEPYMNPLTEMVFPGGTITVYVEADVPKGYAIDYWKINEVPYYFNRTVTSFTVHELDETTVYEVVLRKESAASSTPKQTAKPTPTVKPTPTPVYTPKPTVYTPDPTPEPVPVDMCTVTCRSCYFTSSENDIYSSSNGQVPKGTVIRIEFGIKPMSPELKINGKSYDLGPFNFDGDGYLVGYYTVKSDTTIVASGVN